MHFENGNARFFARRENRRFEFRHGVRRAHIDPDKAARFAHRIGFVFDLFDKARARRLGRHFDDIAVHVHFPAVIEAAQTAFFIASVEERGAAMRAEFIHHADTALRIAEGNEIFAQNAHAHGIAIGFGHFFRETGGQPIAAHHLAHGRIALDTAEQVVFMVGQHGASSSGSRFDTGACLVSFETDKTKHNDCQSKREDA
jgi:hypothetical protein